MSTFIRLVDFKDAQEKEQQFLEAIHNPESKLRFNDIKQSDFRKIPGSPIAYWVSDSFLSFFSKGIPMQEYAVPRQGFATGNNDRFLKIWHEVSILNFKTDSIDAIEAIASEAKWFPCNKGGSFRKWYGNNFYVANWQNDGYEMRAFSGSVIRNPNYYFKEGITWSTISSSSLSMRYSPKGFIFETKGSVCFPINDNPYQIPLALMNTKVVQSILLTISPTLDFHEGPIGKVPVIEDVDQKVMQKVNRCINISKQDWDYYETSWDFKSSPLIPLIEGDSTEVLDFGNDEKAPLVEGGRGEAEGGSSFGWSKNAELIYSNNRLPYNPKLTVRARELRSNMTKEEKKLWYDFLSNHSERFLRQRIFDHYIVDFYCASAKLIIEVDGSQHYTDDGIIYDQIRTEVLEAYGLHVLRFANNDIRENFEGVCCKIDAFCSPLIPLMEGDNAKPPSVRGEEAEPKGGALQETYIQLRQQWQTITLEMQKLEIENNRIFIEAYGLKDELTPYVPLEEITLTCNPWYRYGKKSSPLIPLMEQAELPLNPPHRGGQCKAPLYEGGRGEAEGGSSLEARLLTDTMKELISYSVGCMLGRYSLDKPGLILANQGESLSDYLKQIPTPIFIPDDDNIIPILDGDWFSDDITGRFKQFLKFTFDTEHYDENLAFIENALGKDIRKYFLKDFYKDHWQRYKKRPIYWLFKSPNGYFSALIYMHRYKPDLVSKLLNDYLRDFKSKLEAQIQQLTHISLSPSSSDKDKIKAGKDIEQTKKMLHDLDDYDRNILYPLATKKIEIDLDNGVKVNYLKFGNALDKIPGLEDKEE